MARVMPRIRTIPPEEVEGELAEVYEQVLETGFPAVPAIFQVASLRPDIARAIVDIYRAMFERGKLPRTTKEAIATWVSALNHCPY
jgi:alkylhydroperoxidase family enzyme